MCYNGHKEFKQCGTGKGALNMTKGKKTTQQERAKISNKIFFCFFTVYLTGGTSETDHIRGDCDIFLRMR